MPYPGVPTTRTVHRRRDADPRAESRRPRPARLTRRSPSPAKPSASFRPRAPPPRARGDERGRPTLAMSSDVVCNGFLLGPFFTGLVPRRFRPTRLALHAKRPRRSRRVSHLVKELGQPGPTRQHCLDFIKPGAVGDAREIRAGDTLSTARAPPCPQRGPAWGVVAASGGLWSLSAVAAGAMRGPTVAIGRSVRPVAHPRRGVAEICYSSTTTVAYLC
jgi:hypothetical protein